MFSKCTQFLRFLDGLVVPTSAAVLILRASLQANMLTLISLPRHYNNGCMFSKSTEFLKSSILRAALEAKCLILISFFTLTTARDICVRSPQNGLRIFDALVVLISASHSFLPAAVHAKC